MFAIILSLFSSIRKGFRTRASLQAEMLALRHQFLVLQPLAVSRIFVLRTKIILTSPVRSISTVLA
jgi:hypothetical protein